MGYLFCFYLKNIVRGGLDIILHTNGAQGTISGFVFRIDLRQCPGGGHSNWSLKTFTQYLFFNAYRAQLKLQEGG